MPSPGYWCINFSVNANITRIATAKRNFASIMLAFIREKWDYNCYNFNPFSFFDEPILVVLKQAAYLFLRTLTP